MKIFKAIYIIFIWFIVLIAALMIVSVFPISDNFKIMTVLSGSMESAIKKGSVVVANPANNYNIGDIITFGGISKAETPITHRIYDIKLISGTPVYITKGDANSSPDQRDILREGILGKVIISIPYIGYGVDFAKKPIGFSLLIIIPAILIISDEIRKIYMMVKKKKS